MEGLHFIRFETGRSNIRQAKLKKKGVSRAGPDESPHNHGLAVDFVLDIRKVDVQHLEWPKGSGKFYPSAWDYHGPEGSIAYARYGEIVTAMGLVWGGDFRSINDPPHAEMDNWRSFVS